MQIFSSKKLYKFAENKTKTMKKIYFSFLLFYILGAAKAEKFYQPNEEKINLLFEQAEEIQLSEFAVSTFFTANPLSQNRIAEDEKKVIAGVLGIVVGGLGVHRFYLGHPRAALLGYCLPSLCGLGWIPGLIDGILYLTSTDEEFNQKYRYNQKIYVWLD